MENLIESLANYFAKCSAQEQINCTAESFILLIKNCVENHNYKSEKLISNFTGLSIDTINEKITDLQHIKGYYKL